MSGSLPTADPEPCQTATVPRKGTSTGEPSYNLNPDGKV
jgi:hypothetical protein